jgi:hypothetical protein
VSSFTPGSDRPDEGAAHPFEPDWMPHHRALHNLKRTLAGATEKGWSDESTLLRQTLGPQMASPPDRTAYPDDKFALSVGDVRAVLAVLAEWKPT